MLPDIQIFVPTAFSPNGRGSEITEEFKVVGTNVSRYHIEIFNRWGELVFETKDVNQGWDGYYLDKLSPQDVYVYKVSVRWKDGSKQIKTGSFTLFR